AHFACLVTDNQLVVFDPDGTFCQVVGEGQRATYRDRLVQMLLIHFGIMLCALGTDRRLNDKYLRRFVRLNSIVESVEIQGCHKFILVNSALNLSGRRIAVQSSAGQGYPDVCQWQSSLGRAGCICSCLACDTAENEYRERRV